MVHAAEGCSGSSWTAWWGSGLYRRVAGHLSSGLAGHACAGACQFPVTWPGGSRIPTRDVDVAEGRHAQAEVAEVHDPVELVELALAPVGLRVIGVGLLPGQPVHGHEMPDQAFSPAGVAEKGDVPVPANTHATAGPVARKGNSCWWAIASCRSSELVHSAFRPDARGRGRR